MKIKLLAILVAAFVVLGLPLFARGAKQEGEEETAAQPGVPQYGGTLTAIHRSEPNLGDPDPHDHGYPSWYWMINVLERTIGGDYARYGSFRDGEGGWDNSYWSWPDLKYMRGYLAESWEVTADKIVFKIRPGVYFTGKSPKLNFEPREYTAHDYVWNRHRELDTPTNFSARRMEGIDFIKTPIKDHLYAEDDYTVVYETKRFNFEWYMDLYHCHGMQIARESIEAGEGDWDYMVGTGPFIVKKHVPNAYVEFERNPNYWRKTTVPYGGKEYQLPFVDTLNMPVIKDVTTSVAALRTGKLDIFMYSDWQHHEPLMKTNPEMEYLAFTEHNTYNFHFVTDKPPFDNRDVRRALMFGTDTKAICKAIYGYTPTTLHWPLGEESKATSPSMSFLLKPRSFLNITRIWQGRCWRMPVTLTVSR